MEAQEIHGGAVVSTVASGVRNTACVFSPCLPGFPLGALVSPIVISPVSVLVESTGCDLDSVPGQSLAAHCSPGMQSSSFTVLYIIW